jgi:hypothetical protein
VFAGLGSMASPRWRTPPRATIALAVGVILVFAGGFLAGLDGWLRLTQAWPMAARCLVATGTIAPLAFAMGHLFPLGLERAAREHGALVPWGWAVNGFASVAAAAGAPLFAMRFGFGNLVLVAMGAYAAAGVLFQLLPAEPVSPAGAAEAPPAASDFAAARG